MTRERIVVVVDESARVPDHVRVAFLEPEEARGIEACVHAGDDANFLPGGIGRPLLANPAA